MDAKGLADSVFAQIDALLSSQVSKLKGFSRNDLASTEVPFQLVGQGQAGSCDAQPRFVLMYRLRAGDLDIIPDEQSNGVDAPRDNLPRTSTV
jgi:hypothetical protein